MPSSKLCAYFHSHVLAICQNVFRGVFEGYTRESSDAIYPLFITTFLFEGFLRGF